MMIEPEMISQLLHPTFSEEELANSEVLVTGLAASPGAATGRVYFSSEKIKENKLSFYQNFAGIKESKKGQIFFRLS